MVMEREAYENLLGELNSPELDQSRKTDILTALRNDYNGIHGEFEDLTTTVSKLKEDKDDLVLANSKLFRSQGIVKEETKKEEVKKEFSETVTLEELEKRRK